MLRLDIIPFANIADFEMDTGKFLARMTTLARLDADRWQKRLRSVASRMGGTINPGLISASLDRDESAQSPPRTIGEMEDRLPPERWQAPLVLAIDEFQTIGRDDQAPVAKLLMSLHEANFNLPVMLVLGGLGNTVDMAREIGLTRGLTTTGIGCLSDGEAKGLIHGWCRHYGMNPHGHARPIKTLVTSTDGWPRHLHFALQALAGTLVQPGVDGRLEHVDWEDVLASNMQLRQRYYRARMSPQMEESAYLVGAVMRELQEGHGQGDIIDSIERHAGSRPGSRWRLPEGMTVKGLTSHLIQRGALHRNSDMGTVECPIPGFRTWLINQGRAQNGPQS